MTEQSRKWTRFTERQPLSEPDQVDVFWYSPGWATFMRGVFTKFVDGGHDWLEYDAMRDKFVEWKRGDPVYWMLAPVPTEELADEHRAALRTEPRT